MFRLHRLYCVVMLAALSLVAGFFCRPAVGQPGPSSVVDNKCDFVKCSGEPPGWDNSTVPPTFVPECTLLSSNPQYLDCVFNPEFDCGRQTGATNTCNGVYLAGVFPLEEFRECESALPTCNVNYPH